MLGLPEHTLPILRELRALIKERGTTQLEIQERLGWGKTYVSQLLSQAKGLRLEQLLAILDVLQVEPEAFWARVYDWPQVADQAERLRAVEERVQEIAGRLVVAEESVERIAGLLESVRDLISES